VRKSALTAAVSTGNNILSGTIIGGGVIGLSAFLFGYWRFKRKKKGVAQQ
jgi:hypothetical protein